MSVLGWMTRRPFAVEAFYNWSEVKPEARHRDVTEQRRGSMLTCLSVESPSRGPLALVPALPPCPVTLEDPLGAVTKQWQDGRKEAEQTGVFSKDKP